jgi:hypothetical protein
VTPEAIARLFEGEVLLADQNAKVKAKLRKEKELQHGGGTGSGADGAAATAKLRGAPISQRLIRRRM